MTTSHSSVLGGLVWLLTVAVVVPWLVAGESSVDAAECQRSCGGVDIPFPFGMGKDGCMLSHDFYIVCYDTGNGTLKPFLTDNIDDATELIREVEVLNISLEHGEARVLHPISSYCYNPTFGKMELNTWQLTLRSSYTFSSTANMFTVVGCRTLAYISNTKDNDAMMSQTGYQTGCVAMCFDGNVTLNPCSGMGCCQTAIPNGLQEYEVSFDQNMSISGIDSGVFGHCSFAVLMMDSFNFNLSTAYSGGSNFSNISTGFNTSHGGTAPVVLEWSIGDDGCPALTSPGYACVSDNSFCYKAANRRGYNCNCTKGFKGNPYISHGCEDINECNHPDEYPCIGECTNTIGSFNCRPKDAFPRGARIAAGILVGVFVALIAFLSTEVLLNKESKKIQGYFEQHGGRMLLRILETDDNNIAFKLYERGDLVKATHGFHKANIVGQGAHGTVYKATLGGGAADSSSTTTVAVKRCNQIDKSRTDEFVQELVVLCRVSHPNIVRLLGCCLHFEAPMLVYEFVPNGTLSDLLHRRPRRQVTLPTRLRIAAETAEALKHLHSPPHPTLHGDVKPENILLGDGWVAKVSDFGCSTINDNVQVVPKGTLAYLDPEFLQNFQITEKTDVYSFGVVLIELLTGKNPQVKQWKNLTVIFQDSMGNDTLGELLDPDIVEEASKGLIYAVAKLVSRCIAVPGNGRPAMEQVTVELRRFSDQMPESPEARVALEFEDRRYSYTATEGQTTGYSNLTALSTELAR